MLTLIYDAIIKEGSWPRARGHDLEALIAVAESEPDQYDQCWVEYPNGRTAWHPGLGEEKVQQEQPEDAYNAEWWFSFDDGCWHQEPC